MRLIFYVGILCFASSVLPAGCGSQATAQKQAAKKAAEQAAKQMMQQELAAETKTEEKSESATAESAAAAQNQGEIDKYKTLIIQAISQKWIVPENLSKGLEAKLLVTLAPGGMVVNVKIVKSSGDEVLDRSAETAVYKASPLPVPNDSTLFNQFRTINLIVHPEGIIAGGE
jgi:colicin import membrane protein